MNKGFIAGGSGANPLNFKVLGGTVQPENPRENAIWVNTEEKISSWLFSFTQPESPTEGMVWFFTGNNGGVALGALKKNQIALHVLQCKQYLAESWVPKPAMVYQQQSWKSLVTYLYYKGELYEEITGGWESTGIGSSSEYNTPSAPNITYSESTVQVKGTTAKWASGAWHTVNKIDLTPFSTVSIKILSRTNGSQGNVYLAFARQNGPYIGSNCVARFGDLETVSLTDGYYTADVSAVNEEVFVRIDTYVASGITLDEIRLDV